MKKEKPIIVRFNYSKYHFSDEELIYNTNKIIYKYDELFPKSESYINPFKIKKLKLISIDRMESSNDIFGDLDKKFLYKLWFIDNKNKIYDASAGEGIFIYCSDDELGGKYNIGYISRKHILDLLRPIE